MFLKEQVLYIFLYFLFFLRERKEGIDKISLKHKTNLYLNFFYIYFKLENFLFFI